MMEALHFPLRRPFVCLLSIVHPLKPVLCDVISLLRATTHHCQPTMSAPDTRPKVVGQQNNVSVGLCLRGADSDGSCVAGLNGMI